MYVVLKCETTTDCTKMALAGKKSNGSLRFGYQMLICLT